MHIVPFGGEAAGPARALVVGWNHMCAVTNQRCILVKQVGGRAVFLDDDDHVLNLWNVVVLAHSKGGEQHKQRQH